MNICIRTAGINTFLLGSLVVLQSCVFSNGSLGPRVEEERKVGNFTALRVSSGIDIELSQGNQPRIIISAAEDVIDDVKTEVIGDELRLSVDGNWFRRGRVEARITFVELENLDVSAGSDVETENQLHFENLKIEASSGSDVKIQLEARDVELRASSGSDANLEGRARRLYAKASSGSDINAYDFEVEEAVLELSSGSDVKVWVTGTLEVDASSGSDVYYKGDPKLLDINTSSGADVNRR